MAHEFGHGTGELADEYCARPGSYTGGEPGAPNLTINTNRATLKWRQFVSPATPVPTGTGACADYNAAPKPAGWSNSDDAGLFEGGGTWSLGIYRPAVNCRMRGNSPPYCPVCYTRMKTNAEPYAQHTFQNVYAGDFNGDGKDDILVHSGNNWSIPYLGMLRSNGTSLSMSKRYDGTMPGWQMRANDRHYVGDFDGDGKDDLYVFNGTNWSIAYLGMLESTGSQLSMTGRYDGNAPGWQMRAHDMHWIADINRDGKADLFVYNHQDWTPEYLGTMISSGTDLVSAWKEDWVGEWNLGTVDRFEPCDFEGVGGRRDLIVRIAAGGIPDPKLEVALFRIMEDLPADAAALAAAEPAPLGDQFQRELRKVARLKGIKPDKLAKPVADQLKKAFK